MGKVIAVTNQKGGVGKTTTSVNLSGFVAAMGYKTLVIDIDPQGNATSGLGIEKRSLKKSVYNVLVGDIVAEEIILPTTVKNLEIIPSSIELVGAEVDLVRMDERDSVLKKSLARLRNAYDFIFIDCPPSLGLLTVNALSAANSVLIPIQGEFYALEGLSQLMNTIRLVKRSYNQSLEVEGVLLTMFDGRSNLVNSVADEIHKYFGKKVYDTKIPRNVRLGEAPSYGIPIMQFDAKASGSIAYKRLAEELLERNSLRAGKITRESVAIIRPQQPKE